MARLGRSVVMTGRTARKIAATSAAIIVLIAGTIVPTAVRINATPARTFGRTLGALTIVTTITVPGRRAENYYRDGRYYRPVRLTRNDRIYRGRDNRYYCRRSDGTTGLVVGAALGGVVGNRLDQGGSSILGTLLGAGVGAAIGSSVDRGQVVCR